MIYIRQAHHADIEQLITLNNAWQYIADNEDQKTAGFLVNATFTATDLQKIINAQEIVVAETGRQIIGYYLIDNHSDTPALKHNQQLIKKLYNLNLVSHPARIGARAQAVIDMQSQNQGLSRKMFEFLKQSLPTKFDSLFSTVHKSNPKIIAHQKVGWQVIYQDDDWFYVLYHLKQ